ncbi:MBL fold metallo-hydrolase [Cetobacterium sp. SF1]|uniref:MBL fold metallo-hydrolase n=1 Tax=unclassified Cetobacterium TaxID=2630983 RepID=UPI003CE6A6E0
MKVSILGSGSRGNSIFLEIDNKKILVDAGFSGKKIEEKLNEIKKDIKDIEGILITHEHSDHLQGAGILSRKYGIPIYITKESYMAGKEKLGKVAEENLKYIENTFFIDSIKVIPFDVMHDAERTIGYRIESSRGKKIAISTDIGYINNVVRKNFKDVDIAIIESNYDYNMLMKCNYPWDLKARVKSRNGHLSNEDAGKFIEEIYHENLKKVYLAHISKDSNKFHLALETVKNNLKKENIEVDLEVAYQDTSTKLFEI